MKTALILTALLELTYLSLSFYLAELFGQWSYEGEIAPTFLRIISIIILLYCYRRFFCINESPFKPQKLRHPAFAYSVLLLITFAILFSNADKETFIWQYVFATSGLLAGVREELFYRGIIQQTLQSRFNYRIALLLSCALFTASHIQYIYYQQFFAVMLITLAGLIFGSLFIYSGSVFVVGLIHGIYDALLSIQLTSFHLSPQAALTLLLLITLLSLVMIGANSSKESSGNTDSDADSNTLSMQ